MKNILLFSHEYSPCLGGAGSVASIIKKGLETEFSSNCSVTLLTSSRSKNSSEKSIKAAFLTHKLWPVNYIPFLFNISKFDCVICNDPASIYNAGRYFSQEMLSRTICIIHGEEKYLSSSSLPLKLMKFSLFFRKALFDCKQVIFVSQYIKEQYIKIYEIEIPEDKCTVIHSGISDLSKPLYCSPPQDVIKFLTVSRVEKGKGFDTMLAIFNIILESKKEIRWEIIGDGSYLEDFKYIVSKSKMKNNVFFHGAIERGELSEHYSSSHFYISLSELNESYGLSYLEASSCGTFPIGYNRCGTSEAFKYIENGLLLDEYKDPVKAAIKILNLIKDGEVTLSKCTRSERDFVKDLVKYVL
ncbi:glycosyltransferase family 4 protein [Pectobacterium parmentieri]|uniref:glycosyltransferase family 4 protein n=1 Tax=Pectobacterium parmentieri TaxID=1905730 RepID=UPI0018E0F9EE|nr:glycosyltransferase family 4 protein [Pectobacterium parmentieri]QQA77467.1 glycosyltransferase family 4 protein [Pectobacterium parmentieri]